MSDNNSLTVNQDIEPTDSSFGMIDEGGSRSGEIGFMGSDSTSCTKAILVAGEHAEFLGDGDLALKIDDMLAIHVSEDPTKKEVQVTEVLQLISDLRNQVNVRWHSIIGCRTYRDIQMGRLLQLLKNLVGHGQWDAWANQNVPFLKTRTRQVLMQIGDIPGAELWAFVGKEILVHLYPHIKRDGNDPIKAFLDRHDLKFDPESEESIGEFKLKVDAAAAMDRLAKDNVKVSRDLVEKWLRQGHILSSQLVGELKIVQESNGSCDKALRHRLENQGRASSQLEPAKRIMSIKATAAKLRDAVEAFRKDPTLLLTIEVADVEAINTTLRELGNLLLQTPAELACGG